MVVELARWLCLAARVEPALVRHVRVHLMPGADAGVEADLWFSPLVQTAGARYVMFYPEVSNRLRRELATDRERLAAAWRVTRRVHRGLPELVRLEEKLTWLALSGGARLERRLDALLRPVIKALLMGQREGLGRWALSALPRLPEHVRAAKSARLLQAIAESQLYGGWTQLLTTVGDGPTEEEAALLIHGLERVRVGLLQRGSKLEVIEPPPSGSCQIEVPATNPRVLELSWPGEEAHAQMRLVWNKGAHAFASGVKLPVTVNTLAGDTHRMSLGREVFKSYERAVAPSLAFIYDEDFALTGLGVLVSDRYILTTARSINGMQKQSAKGESEVVIYVQFHLPHLEQVIARIVSGKYDSDDVDSTDYPVLLRIEESVSSSRPVEVNFAGVAPGRRLVAVQVTEDGRSETWISFETGVVGDDGQYALTTTVELDPANLFSCAGSPLLDAATSEVLGVLLVHDNQKGITPKMYPLEDIAQTFPVIYAREVNKSEPDPDTFEHDVYISYAHADDKPLEGEKGWVTSLVERLRIRFAQRTGEEPSICFDSSLIAGVSFTDRLVVSIARSKLFLPIVSPSYLESEWCIKELREFSRSAMQTGGLRVGNRSRILPVYITPVERESLPPELGELLGYEFFEFDEHHQPREFRPKIGRARDKKYWKKIDDLAWDIKETIGHLGKVPSAAASDAPELERRREDRTSIYLICHEKDFNAVTPIAEGLRKRGYNLFRSATGKANPQVLLEDHRRRLSACDAAFVYCGKANLDWVRDQLIEIQKSVAAKRARPLRAVGLYVGPPATKKKEEFILKTRPGEILIKNFDAFLPGDLEPFLSLLSENEPGSERMS
ncbi:MAG: hypothetical protein QOJ70_2243 [Acidobacteriota bacterium]|nr:hypothetical protein [Acidobacteriota bacterium]